MIEFLTNNNPVVYNALKFFLILYAICFIIILIRLIQIYIIKHEEPEPPKTRYEFTTLLVPDRKINDYDSVKFLLPKEYNKNELKELTENMQKTVKEIKEQNLYDYIWNDKSFEEYQNKHDISYNTIKTKNVKGDVKDYISYCEYCWIVCANESNKDRI